MRSAETVLGIIHCGGHWRAGCSERRTPGSGRGGWKSAHGVTRQPPTPLCATTARGGYHVTINSWQPCCTRDEGRPLGLGLQDQGPNHRKLRRFNGRGGERCGKRRDQSRQVCAGQTNVSEPLLTCRKRRDVAKTRLPLWACDKARRKPADWPSGDRHEDGVRPARGSCAERGTLSPRCEGRPPRETSKGQTPEEPSTDARRRGGRVRSVCLAAGVSGGLKSHSVRGPGPISEGGGNASPARVDGRYGEASEARRRKPGHG